MGWWYYEAGHTTTPDCRLKGVPAGNGVVVVGGISVVWNGNCSAPCRCVMCVVGEVEDSVIDLMDVGESCG
jgi:hypothetical protein